MRLLRVLPIVVALLVSGCSQEPVSIFERHRPPDDEGVVEEIGPAGLKLMDGRGYELASDVEMFTTARHNRLQHDDLRGRYVHVGVDDDGRAFWIASIGLVTEGEVFYAGNFQKVEDGQAFFEDGTVLRLDDGVTAPEGTGSTLAVLSAERKVVTQLRRQS